MRLRRAARRCAISGKLMESLDIFSIASMCMGVRVRLVDARGVVERYAGLFNLDGPVSTARRAKDNLKCAAHMLLNQLYAKQ